MATPRQEPEKEFTLNELITLLDPDMTPSPMVVRAARKRLVQQRRFAEFVMHAPVGTGICCCGESMDNHPSTDHQPVDEWVNHVYHQLEELGCLPEQKE